MSNYDLHTDEGRHRAVSALLAEWKRQDREDMRDRIAERRAMGETANCHTTSEQSPWYLSPGMMAAPSLPAHAGGACGHAVCAST